MLGAKVFLNHRQPSQEVAPQRVWQRQFVVARPAIGSLDFQMDLSKIHVKEATDPAIQHGVWQ